MRGWLSRNGYSILALITFFGGNAIAAFLITACVPFDRPINNAPIVSVSPTIPVKDSQAFGTRTHSATPNIRTIANCENANKPTVPCVTWDQNEWRMVTDYTPYRFTVLPVCVNSKVTPCINEDESNSHRVIFEYAQNGSPLRYALVK